MGSLKHTSHMDAIILIQVNQVTFTYDFFYWVVECSIRVF